MVRVTERQIAGTTSFQNFRLRPALSDARSASGTTRRLSIAALSFPLWMTGPIHRYPLRGRVSTNFGCFGAVAQCLPQPVHCLVEIVLEIDKRVGGPKSFL